MNPLEVVCALIIDNNGNLLACKRGSHQSHPRKWEFPGGKIEVSETKKEALIREISEELGVNIISSTPLPNTIYSYSDFTINLYPFLCKISQQNKLSPTEHSEIRWLDLDTKSHTELDWAKADIPILNHYIKSLPMTNSSNKLIVFDCDSTLSSIEGIDELAREKGTEIFQEVEALTNAAMNGEVPLDEVFSRRLEIIQPNLATCKKIEQLYIDTVEPTALETLTELKKRGFSIIILSGGFKRLIEPLASYLGIERIEAVPLNLSESGDYINFDSTYPTTYNGGKPEIIEKLKAEFSPEKVIMVGDGVSDLETKNIVDKFIGYGKYTDRKKVREEADHFIYSLADLLDII